MQLYAKLMLLALSIYDAFALSVQSLARTYMTSTNAVGSSWRLGGSQHPHRSSPDTEKTDEVANGSWTENTDEESKMAAVDESDDEVDEDGYLVLLGGPDTWGTNDDSTSFSGTHQSFKFRKKFKFFFRFQSKCKNFGAMKFYDLKRFQSWR